MSTSIWDEIVSYDQAMLDLYNGRKGEECLRKGSAVLASNYYQNEIYPQLIPALKTMLVLAARKCTLKHQKCVFNGIDCLAEMLYNRNPNYPERANNWTPAYFVFYDPEADRPIYPLSWILTREEAARIIQKWVRGYNVRKGEEVQEMVEFWKIVSKEKWLVTAKKFPSDRCKRREPYQVRWY